MTRENPAPRPDRPTLSASQRNHSRARAKALDDAMKEFHRLHGADTLYVHTTQHGRVAITHVETSVNDDGVTVVDVYLDGQVEGGDPHFRILNPPGSVIDPTGTEVLPDGRKVRIDPLAAIAEVIAQHGGAQVRSGRR